MECKSFELFTRYRKAQTLLRVPNIEVTAFELVNPKEFVFQVIPYHLQGFGIWIGRILRLIEKIL